MKIHIHTAKPDELAFAVAFTCGWRRAKPVINGTQRAECWWPADYGDPAAPPPGASVLRQPEEFFRWDFCGKLIDAGYCVMKYHGEPQPPEPYIAHFAGPRELFSSGRFAREALLRAYLRRTSQADEVEVPDEWEELL